mmetsp:Transcript_1731/g.4047  ORF Transcript_1731/g.4047 Transcript_1731/m.4047 type:complete len:194 (-) Transcript_1731:1322-1903(-)|eukprot:CAMPEP_0173176442 /NCGR_PEP_ID=MMETSP1141-20130122/4448_1 /TAXON_ID=483371 /ORGANISM="non described non described, Strain CCMP2298" /LENGTH=193 /DNA_ID=CAMNT_0014098753 /DNA_START=1648 /DNA_END=2229 /DNA_ORIENTATION=-
MSAAAKVASHLTTRAANNAQFDIESILSLTNVAFMADSFFKKPDYHQRFDRESVLSMIQAERSEFILASTSIEGSQTDVGSLFLNWDVKQEDSRLHISGKFSAVSVPAQFGRRGVGSCLVRAAEARMLQVALELKAQGASMEMGVINQRADLFPWYEAQGYQQLHELPNDAELTRICLEGVDICCVLMKKVLL